MRPPFITFEGVEGCGKTTQIRLLQEHLDGRGYTLLVTREPGGPPISEAVRNILLDPAHGTMTAPAELLLYAAARAQHVRETILPALEGGTVVLCDRFTDSTVAYQGSARKLDEEAVDWTNAFATGGLAPDRTYLLDLDPEAGLGRTRGRGRSDRLEREALAFHHRVREGYLRLAESAPDRIRIVDAAKPIEDVARHIREDADALLATATEA